MIRKNMLELLEQVRDQEGDWRVALEDAIDMVTPNPVVLSAMVQKAYGAPEGRRGYISQTPEIIDILLNLTPYMSWNVFPKEGIPEEQQLIGIDLQTGFYLDKRDF